LQLNFCSVDILMEELHMRSAAPFPRKEKEGNADFGRVAHL